MDIPPILRSQIQDGKVVLVLGAGASLDATDAQGNRPPTGRQLSGMLADKFLGGKYADLPLNQVGEFAVSETDLTTVQEYLRKVLEPFQPSPAHLLMASFTWWGLGTTNYDRLIEKAYASSLKPHQTPIPFIENGDRVEERMRDPGNVMLLKLHGCITRTNNPGCPLILTTDQYIEHRKGRSRLFDHLRDWAFEHHIVFVGHSLQDPDLRTILLELTTQTETRPRYYAVAPHFDDIQVRFWEGKKITPLPGTFHEFLSSLDQSIPTGLRALSVCKRRSPGPIQERFGQPAASLSPACDLFLQVDTDYVKDITSTEVVIPQQFYKGLNPGWSAIEQGLDVRRNLADTILSDHFLITEAEHLERVELIVIKAHAGAGKSVLLQRMAWDASHDYNRLCLFMRPHGVISTAAIQELIAVCGERLYLFVDDAADRVREIQSLANNIGIEGKLLTVVVAERVNEWNVSCEALSPLVTSSYELSHLGANEIDRLLVLLETHHALGTLETKTPEARRAAFTERAGRQLLVALHEATLGRPFEDTIEDEYNHIQPDEAQRMYLTICVLNRLSVAVRAGIIKRIHGIRFEDFKNRLFAPLEHVVLAKFDPIIRDYTYQARHPHIAEIVFERILHNAEERYDAYIKCLRELNIDYTADRRAFRKMVRGRVLLEMFCNPELGSNVHKVASETVGNDSYLMHQMALFELHRPDGSLDAASNLLVEASRLAPRDHSIKHSAAELALRRAEAARTPLERETFLRQAKQVAQALKSERRDEVYGYHTLAKIGLSKIRERLNNQESDDSGPAIEILVRELERDLSDALQRFPGDSYLLEADARLGDLLSDSQRVVQSLRDSFLANPRSSFIAIRLAHIHSKRDELEESKQVLETALDANRNERRLHYELAKTLLKMGGIGADRILYHLQRSFVPGDTNYDAQLLYARQMFIAGDRDGSRALFRQLQTARVGADLLDRLSYPLDGRFGGQVARLEASYCFLARDGLNDWIYAHRSNISEAAWRALTLGTRVVFSIAFSLRGINAFDVILEPV